MDNAIIVNESVNFEKTERVLTVKRILLKVLIVAMVFVAALCLFAVFGSEETLLGKIGSAVAPEFQTRTSAVAYAWNNPTDSNKKSNGGYTSCDYSSATAIVKNQNATLKTGTETSESWNYYSRTYSGSGMSYASGGISANQKSSYSASMLFYVDIYLDDAIRSAIAHGQISSCSVAMKVADSGGAYWRDVGHFYGTFFLCASATGTTSAELNDMGDSEWTGNTPKWASWKTFDNQVGGGRVDKTSGTLTITLDATMKKIRYGAYLRITYDGSGTSAETFLKAPTTTSAFNAGTYKKPSITVKNPNSSYGTVTADSGYDNSFKVGTKYSANYKDSGDGTTIGNIVAKANAGYYFSGWEISSGAIEYYKSGSTTITKQDQLSLTLSLPGGYALSGDVVVTAHFKKIECKDYETGTQITFGYDKTTGNINTISYTYKQSQDGSYTGVKQGPIVIDSSVKGSVTDASFAFTLKSGTIDSSSNFAANKNGTYYTGGASYKQGVPPTESGSYTYTIGVFKSSSSSECLGYINVPFRIAKKSIASDGFTVLTELPERVYMGYAYNPTAECIDIKDNANGLTYRIKWDDFKTPSYSSNINVGQGIISLTASDTSNFTGSIVVYYNIVQRSLDTVEVVPEMAAEIQKRYSLYYNSYEQRPLVLQVRVKATVINDKGKEVEEKFTLYYGVGSEYVNGYASKGYEALPQETNDIVSLYQIVNLDIAPEGGEIDVRKAYNNNINVTTETSRASFVISMTSGNFSGSKVVEFDIGALNLDLTGKDRYVYDMAPKKDSDGNEERTEIFTGYTVAPQEGTLVYDTTERELTFDYVLVTVEGLPCLIYDYGIKMYSTNTKTLTFYIRRDGTVALSADKLDELDATDSGSTYSITKYSDNINVARDEQGNVLKKAIAEVKALGSNITGKLETAFAIMPKDLKEAQARFGNTITETYTGARIEPSNKVNVKVNTIGSEFTIKLNEDFEVTFGDNIDATTGGNIYVNGIGNYTGTIENNQSYTVGSKKITTGGQFFIVAIDASKGTITRLSDEEYALGSQINPRPAQIILTVNGKEYKLEAGRDFSVVEGSGTNTDVGEGNYISVMFAGYNPKSDEKGMINETYGSLGNFYTSTALKAYFTIVQRNIGSIKDANGAEYFASWAAAKYRDSVTYDGTQKTGLTIVANQSKKEDNTLYIQDSIATATGTKTKVLKFGDSKAVAGTDYIFEEVYGRNIDAGINAGTLTVTGVNNYTGTLVIPFTIYARDLTDNVYITVKHSGNGTAEYDTAADGYKFTGSQIMPTVTDVNDDGLKGGSPKLIEGTDFAIVYGGSEEDTSMNYYVKTGGVIKIEGKGNYTGVYECLFDIVPISQTIEFKNPYTDTANSTLKLETIATKDAGYGFYADYEIASDGKGNTKIRLEATTDAIYPSARRVTFVAVKTNGGTSEICDITYESCEIVIDQKEKSLSKTVAWLTVKGSSYGIIRIYAEQYDSSVLAGMDKSEDPYKVGEESYYNYGNYLNHNYSESNDSLYAVYAKKTDSMGNTDSLEFTYGNNDEKFFPKLDSYKNNSAFISTCTIADESILSLVDTFNGSFVTLRINGAGTTTLTVSHNGFVNKSNEADAYVAFAETRNVTINKRKLTIGFEPLTIEYGVNPAGADYLFTYTYTTECDGDSYKGLQYGNRTDDPQEIIASGLSVTYNKNVHKAKGYYDLKVIVSNSPTVGRLYNNYDISYGGNVLTVVPATLIVNATNTNQVGQLVKTYGDDNPKDYRFSYSGFVYDENDNVITTTPTIDYSGKKDGFDKVDVSTPCGSYNVRIYGGEADNYILVYATPNLLVDKASVTITVAEKTISYTGENFAANTPIISGCTAEGCTVPLGADDERKIEIRYYQLGSSQALPGSPAAAGSYNVKVKFTATDKDNYKTTTVTIENAITIEKVEPVVTYTKRQIEYSEQGIPLAELMADISGIPTGSSPMNRSAEKYLIAKNGEAPEGCLEDETYTEYFTKLSSTDNNVLGKGWYDIIVVYEANGSDNYKGCVKRFDKVIEITSGLAKITMKESISEEYSGKKVALKLTNDDDSDFSITFTDPRTNVTTQLDASHAFIEYYVDGAFTTTAPVNAGTYQVRVTYVPASTEEVARTEAIFANAITIEKYDLKEHNGISLSLVGDLVAGYHTYYYDGKGHTLGKDEIIVNGIEGGSTPTGELAVIYVDENGNKFNSPVNVGWYKVVVSYESHGADNYTCSGTITMVNGNESEQILRIEAVAVGITALSLSSSYDYTGKSFTFGASCSGVTVDGVTEVPTGTLTYEYFKEGGDGWTSEAPVKAGTYDVRVIYNPVKGDNYAKTTSGVFSKAITINAVQPIITISSVRFDYGDTNIGASYVIKGAQFDADGPTKEIGTVATLTIQYSKRLTSQSGSTYYDWQEDVPSDSGKYSVRITFTALMGSDYLDVIATQYDCVIISNVAPTLLVENKVVDYDGNRHQIDPAQVLNGQIIYLPYAQAEDKMYGYYGTVSYEYRKSGTTVWTSSAPQNAGVYDVRVKYNENTSKDIFTSTSVVITGGLTINKLVINVAPVYGQGKIYDGKATVGSDLAYVYSYKTADGNIEYVYSNVVDNATGDRIDVSRATYVASNGEVYTVWTDTDSKFIAWRDYIEVAVEFIAGEFEADGHVVNVNYEAIGETSGEAVIMHEGSAYIIDLDNDFAYRRKADTSYNVTEQSGYFFSVVDAYGRVRVIKIDEGKLSDVGRGNITDTVGSTTTSYSINLATLDATANGESFKIYKLAYKIECKTDSGVSTYYDVDPSHLIMTANPQFAYYKTSTGKSFLIDLDSYVAQDAYEITVKNARATYNDEVYEFTPSDLVTGEYYANAYIGNIALGEHSATVDMVNRHARISLTDTVEYDADTDNYLMVKERLTFGTGDLESAGRNGLYKLDMGYAVYYIEFTDDGIVARNSENKAEFDTFAKTITRTENGASVVIGDVDKAEFTYNRMHTVRLGGKNVEVKADFIKLFDVDCTVSAPELIKGNEWSGTLSINATQAGEYDIASGTLTAGANYEIAFSKGGIQYYIDKASLTVEFIYDDNSVYNGEEKFIYYDIKGLIGYDDVSVTAQYQGERREVSEAGYKLVIEIDSANYVLVNGESKWCSIEPAQMPEIVFVPATGIVYDGKEHKLALTDLPSGVTVTYDGKENAPSFVNPGTYVVTAVVSRANYNDAEIELSLTINKCPFDIKPDEVPGTLTYGDPLPVLTADTTLGKIQLDAGQILDPSITTYTWTFVPNDTDFYTFYEGNAENGNVIRGTIELYVQKAKAKIVINENLVQTENNRKTLIAYINDLSQEEYDNIVVEYVGADGTRYAQMPKDVGQYTVIVTYGGNEYYDETVYTATLTIKDEDNFEWLIYVGIGLLTLALASTVFFLFRKKS